MKILVADDHELIRDGLERNLKGNLDGVEVIQACDASSVESQLNNNSDLDIILLDLIMPGSKGFSLLEMICNDYAHIPVVVVSAEEEPRHMRKVIDIGASGFIPKSSSTEVMLSAIKLVCSGGVYIPADMLKQKKNKNKESLNSQPETLYLINETRDAFKKLTPRQAEVLDLMARGLSNKEIAKAYGLSEHTVKIHVTAVLKLFNAENRTEAVVMAHNAGVLDA